MATDPGERRAELLVLASFGATGMCGLGLVIVYLFGGQTQIEGLLLFGALGGLGIGIVLWGQRLMPTPVRIEPRGQIGSGPETIADLEQTLLEESGFTRRKLLLAALAGGLASLAAALTLPVLSLGPAPGRSLFVTSWREGRRLSRENAEPITADSLAVGGVVTVFPDGDTADPNAATLLIRVGPSGGAQPSASAAPAQAEFVALSKICTHAGCPVGLYRASDHILICPCHQSEFDVLDGARPINGPAARPLPALPFRLEADGTFTALGDFPEPVGPSFWDMDL